MNYRDGHVSGRLLASSRKLSWGTSASSGSDRKGALVFSIFIALVVGGYPIAASIVSLTNVDSRLVTIPYRGLVLFAAALVIYQSALLGSKKSVSGGVVPLFLCIWVGYVARLFADTMFFPVPLSLPVEEYWLYAIGTAFLPALSCLFVQRASDFERGAAIAFACLLIGGGVSFAFGLSFANQAIVVANAGRMETDTLNPISLGHLGVSLILIGVYRILNIDYKTQLRRYRVAYYLVGSLFGLIVLVTSASRGPVVALVGSFAALLFVYRRYRLLMWGLGAIIVAAALAGSFEESLGLSTVSRFSDSFDMAVDATSLERIVILQNSIEQYAENWFFGSGLEEREFLSYPHNLFVEAFMAIGLFGGIAFMGFFVISLTSALGVLKYPGGWIGLIFLQTAIGALFSGSPFFSTVYWVSALASIGLRQMYKSILVPWEGGYLVRYGNDVIE